MTLKILAALAVFVWCTGALAGVDEPAPDCSRLAGSLPDPQRAAGVSDPSIPIEHFVFLMEENHSFDSFLGRLNASRYREDELDGIKPDMSNPGGDGKSYRVFHQNTYCVANPNHSWDGSHFEWNTGLNDGFVKQNGDGHRGARVMGYYEEPDLKFLYAVASRFSVGDRYFSSLLGPTFPNRSFFYAASAYGHVRNNFRVPKSTPLIFDVMSAHGVSWKYYVTDLSIAREMLELSAEARKHFANVKDYRKDLANGRLPSVVFLETSELFGEEHPPFDFQHGQRETAQMLLALVKSHYWAKSAFFLVYDEHGGYFDHVAPPRACEPDDILPKLGPKDKYKGSYDRYGIRVPLVVASPYAKKHFVSHTIYDHTSLLKLVETKFNLPALTRRDANAAPMLDLFNFRLPPQLDFPEAPLPKPDLLKCIERSGR